MAGMTLRGGTTSASSRRYPGQTYNSALGGYQPTAPRLTVNSSGQVVQSATPPTTYVSTRENPNTKFFDQNVVYYNPSDPQYGGSGGGTMAAPRVSTGGGARPSGLTDLLNQIKGGSFVPAPAPRPPTQREGDPYDRAAESAAYTSAKERTGLAMQSAMKGLQSAMSSRGITGSTIEGDALRQLFESGLGELAGTDRQLAEKFADRAFTAENLDLSRDETQRQFDAGFGQTEAAREQDAAMSRLQRILQAYGMFY